MRSAMMIWRPGIIHCYRPAKFRNSPYSLHLTVKSILSICNRTCTSHMCRLTPLSLHSWQSTILPSLCTHAETNRYVHILLFILRQVDLTPCAPTNTYYVQTRIMYKHTHIFHMLTHFQIHLIFLNPKTHV